MTKVDHIPIPHYKPDSVRVLWIGARQKLHNPAETLGELLDIQVSHVRAASLSDVNATLIYEECPTLICSMLTWIGGDAFEAAQTLSYVGYRGSYFAFGPGLPQPRLVEREIKSSAPGVDFTLLSLERRSA